MEGSEDMSLIKKAEGLSKFTLTCNFWRKPAWAGSSLGAIGLQSAAVSYCYEHGTDGLLPKDTDSLAAAFGLKAPQVRKAMKELLERGVWVAHKDSLEIVDFLAEHPSVADVKAHRQKREQASIKANHTRWHQEKADPECPLCQDSEPDKPPDSEEDSDSDSFTESQRRGEESRGRGVEERTSNFGDEVPPPEPAARARLELALRLNSACQHPNEAEAEEVIDLLAAHLDLRLIDEAIGWSLESKVQPRRPSYFLTVVSDWGRQRNVQVPALALGGAS